MEDCPLLANIISVHTATLSLPVTAVLSLTELPLILIVLYLKSTTVVGLLKIGNLVEKSVVPAKAITEVTIIIVVRTVIVRVIFLKIAPPLLYYK